MLLVKGTSAVNPNGMFVRQAVRKLQDNPDRREAWNKLHVPQDEVEFTDYSAGLSR